MDLANAITRLAARLPMQTIAPRTAQIAPRANGAEGSDGAGERTSDEAAATLGRDEFLTMLLAQLQHQDPLNPQDATEFTAQLATFSMLERLIAIQAGIGRVERLLEDALAEQGEPAGDADPRAARSDPPAPAAGAERVR